VATPPVPLAVSVSVVPERDADVVMPLPAPPPLATRLSAPPDVIVLLREIALPPAVLAESVRLNPPLPAVETPLPVTAEVSVSVTLPVPEFVVVKLGVTSATLIAPPD